MTVRLAFASTNGREVDAHFGSAPRLEIWDVSADGATRVGPRIPGAGGFAGCGGGGCGGGVAGGVGVQPGPGRHGGLAESVADCAAVFASQIGQGAAAELIGRGIRVFQVDADIEAIIAQLARTDLLAQLEAARPLEKVRGASDMPAWSGEN